MATNYRTDSMYRNTKVVDNNYLDIYNSPITDADNMDTSTMVITPKYHNRPDVLAHDLYGNSKLWWVFAELNQDKLIDPILDFKSGLTIVYPIRFS